MSGVLLAPREALLTRAVDVHMDGLLVALRLQEQQLCDNQAGHAVIDLQVGRMGCPQKWGGNRAKQGGYGNGWG